MASGEGKPSQSIAGMVNTPEKKEIITRPKKRSLPNLTRAFQVAWQKAAKSTANST
ncbi:hypothetical protein [Providencia hangzhouensis]|uniref:hypothetical protein n=1 Tax=Providencia hangzhouensis TaxID=3031799 RepID=UPI0034DDAB37